MKHLSTPAILTAVLVATQLLASAPATAQVWHQIPSPNPNAHRNLLRGIDGTSSTDIWTVGDYQTSPTGLVQYTQSHMINHWDGTAWTTYTPQQFGSTMNSFWDVDAVTPNDVWAVGDYDGGGGASQSQIAHWDGSNWTNQNVNLSTGTSYLWGIDAISANDIWAVGGKAGILVNPAFAYHYDGSNWTEVTVPNVGNRRTRFNAVDGIASNDVWAVGTWGHQAGQFNHLLMHWDGSAWTNYPAPASAAAVGGEMLEVHMVASNDVWAVGDALTGGIVMLHWDGTSWTQVTTHGGGGAIASVSPNDVWAVGAEISHWDGTTWSVVDSLSHLPYPALGAAFTLPNGEVWAAGRTIDANGVFRTLVYTNAATVSSLNVTSTSNAVAPGGTTQLQANIAGSGNYTYRWSPGGSLNDSTIANPVASPGSNTYYTLNVTDQAGNSMQAAITITVSASLSANGSLNGDLQLMAFPNPFSEQLKAVVHSANNQSAQYFMTDALGRTLTSQTITLRAGENQLPISAEKFPAGCYLLSVKTPSQLLQLKLVRQ